MDITNLFKACVKTAKILNRNIGETVNVDTSILPRKTQSKSEFGVKARDIFVDIAKLRKFLNDNLKEYINTKHLSGESSSHLTENDRDQIDFEAQKALKTCTLLLRDFKVYVSKEPCSGQQRDYRDAVLQVLDNHLKGVYMSYSEQRAIRVKRMLGKRKLLLLQPVNSEKCTEGPKNIGKIVLKHDKESKSTVTSDWMEEEDMKLSVEEMQSYEQENERLYGDLSSRANEVKQIEAKIVEISKLQEVFASKVLQQDADIDRIAATVVGTSEDIKGANEQIREAIRKNASFRAWMLFFLLVLTFSILFLDWYNT